MRKKILLVDDEEVVLALLAVTLGNDERYCLLLARDGEEALDIARREKPALVLLDILMPKMNGYEVCRALKSDPATTHIKVIVLTAVGDQLDRGKAVGADGFFAKPFSPTALLKEVEKHLALHHLRRPPPDILVREGNE